MWYTVRSHRTFMSRWNICFLDCVFHMSLTILERCPISFKWGLYCPHILRVDFGVPNIKLYCVVIWETSINILKSRGESSEPCDITTPMFAYQVDFPSILIATFMWSNTSLACLFSVLRCFFVLICSVLDHYLWAVGTFYVQERL